MRITFFSARKYEKPFFDSACAGKGFDCNYVEVHLNQESVLLASGSDVVCLFVNDTCNREIIEQLSEMGVKLIALRSAGFNHVDLKAAAEHNIPVVRVPAYSPYSVAEHTIAIIMTLNRKTHRAYNRVKEGNFSLNGLMGFDLHCKTAGLIGLGKIGKATAKILLGFGCKVLGYDKYEDEECKKLGVEYTSIDRIFSESDIVSLHCPLTPDTHHIINKDTIEKMKDGVMLINTSRGALVDTKAVIEALKTSKIGHLGLDVYEEEGDLFFEDLSDQIITDDVFMRLLTFPNVLITGHQAFFTNNAMRNIADITIGNIVDFREKKELENAVVLE
ncbi:2-hydroxyacid dehydrogenase [Cytophagaceae bacterium ABcell3]|nr:2-hydroxyacid dehydrogenase [Cytophagaceae bacterium ABcell3]